MAKLAKSSLNRPADQDPKSLWKKISLFIEFGLFQCYVFSVCKRDKHRSWFTEKIRENVIILNKM